jgi:hypothetical protein
MGAHVISACYRRKVPAVAYSDVWPRLRRGQGSQLRRRRRNRRCSLERSLAISGTGSGRRSAGALTCRARPPTLGAAGVADAGLHPSAVRGAGHRLGADIADLGEEHGHRVLRVCGKGTKIVLVPLPPAVGRAIDRAIGTRARGPILLDTKGVRMDRHAATRRLRRLAESAGLRIARPHPHMLRHTFITTMLDAGVDLRDVQIAARHADPRTTMRYDRARKNLDRHPNYILAAYMASGT